MCGRGRGDTRGVIGTRRNDIGCVWSVRVYISVFVYCRIQRDTVECMLMDECVSCGYTE